MAFNFIGIPLFILAIGSILGLLAGILSKNRRLRNISLIVLLVVIAIYFILGFAF